MKATFYREMAAIGLRLRDMWRMIPGRLKITLVASIVLMALGSAANTVIPVYLGKLVDSVKGRAEQPAEAEAPATGSGQPGAVVFLAIIGAMYVLREILHVGRRFLVEDTCTRLEKHLFVRLVSHLLRTDRSALGAEKVGTLHGRILRNVSGSLRFLRIGFLDFLPALLGGGFAMTAVAIKAPWLGGVMVAVIPLSVGLTLRQLKSQKGVRLKLLKCRDEMDGTIVEQLEGIDYIRTANTYRQETHRIARSAEALRSRELRHYVVMSLFGSGKALVEGLFHVLVLAISVYLAATGRISFGDILTFSMLFMSVMTPLSEVHRMIDEGHESSLLVGELLKMLSIPVDPCHSKLADTQPVNNGNPVIAVENLTVDFSLAGGVQKRALDGVTLSIRHGEIIGIAGPSGCGKSTFLRALMRLVHVSNGSASLCGMPLESLACGPFAEFLGYVGQSPFVFSSTIEQNIAYEREGASHDEIRNAARRACIEHEILELPGGFRAEVHERGQNLSGGQKQRLALARVFLKDPPVLILDEATSALDTISESRIQEWLSAMRGRRTVILVAHRLSSLLHADRILVFDEGRIVESGSYAELVHKGGLFTRLVSSAGAGAGISDPLARTGLS
jgi:ATP-binding cassette subfamily B protein